MRHLLFATILFISNGLDAQIADSALLRKINRSDRSVPEAMPFAQHITAANLKVYIDSLAGDLFAGRETGTDGQRLAGEYIASELQRAGLKPGGDRNKFFQKIALQNQSWEELTLLVDDKEFANRSDFYVFANDCPSVGTLNLKDFVFVGYGIDEKTYSDYGKTDVKGKALVMFMGEPVDENERALASETGLRTPWGLDWKRKVKLAQQKGAVAVFLVDKNLKESLQKNRRVSAGRGGWTPVSPDGKLGGSELSIPHAFISQQLFAAILGKKLENAEKQIAQVFQKKSTSPIKFKSKVQFRASRSNELLEGTNIIGWLEGSDPEKKNDYVLVTAHYDHLGYHDGKLYYGADDNASGTAAVMEMARVFAEAAKQGIGPRRSVVFMLVSGEEKGLLGSKFYTEFPTFPLKRTIANINIDMIGRIDKPHEGNPNYIYVIGDKRTSQDLHNILVEMNKLYTKIDLDYRYNDPNEPNRYFQRSDHYNFVKKGIPATFFFNGTHDDYHRPTDTREKIDFQAAEIRTRLAFYTIWEIANRQQRVSADFDPDKI